MLAKDLIVDELGEHALLLPQLLERALAANDHVKFCFTLLQSAVAHALNPELPAVDLSAERRAANVAESELDQMTVESRRLPDGAVLAPGAARLRRLIIADLVAMHGPLALAATAQADAFAERQRRLVAALPEFADDRVSPDAVDALTAIDRQRGDSLHLLVMDMHRALNSLQSEVAEESLEGARVWRINPDDRRFVRAFMAGLQKTAPLKFDHPGLGTTATRSNGRLIIQNDIGTTDAHVLVIHVAGLSATLTYTDVHAQRAEFFRSLFTPFAVQWEDTRTRHGTSENFGRGTGYYLCIGRYDGQDEAALEKYLSYLGSRIVFLIDWNRARKRLRDFLAKDDPARLLKWGADENLGHRGFLKLGGERLIYDALEFAQQPPLRYGEKLHEALGRETAYAFLQFVLRVTSEGLRQDRPERLVRDEIRIELARLFHGAHQGVLAIAGDHAALVFDLATSVEAALRQCAQADGVAFAKQTASRAGHWEQAADALVSRMRSLRRRNARLGNFPAIIEESDDAADGLEDAAFLTTLVAGLNPAPGLVQPVHELSTLVVEGTQELVKMLEAASYVTRDGGREDLRDVLEAVERMVSIEHQTDTAERAVTKTLLVEAPDFRCLHLLSNLARTLEEAADALSRCALKLRDHLLHDVMAG